MNKINIRQYNIELIEKYPFLKPKNLWTGLDFADYDYLYTNADDIPLGWRAAFGDLLLEELNQELLKHNFANKYQIIQIKEKFGALRWYDNGVPALSSVNKIIDKYEALSGNICIICGKPDVPIVPISWVSPYCLDCCVKHNIYSKEEYEILKTKSNCKMSNVIIERQYNSGAGNWSEKEIDISDTVEIIRQRWNDGIIQERYDFLRLLYGRQ